MSIPVTTELPVNQATTQATKTFDSMEPMAILMENKQPESDYFEVILDTLKYLFPALKSYLSWDEELANINTVFPELGC
ncbi:hypothetical protein Poli38472_011877 [Pythium oligandrum]|uniref:Uncharacterized protein n=1 Tax=Pythium oligandrum TaxID=41045 RepID=A0A8K1FET8_PYTOL|nr:hypothetical protein Poli38472_011877 [Pythium oligandrum]|eukprot:TMW58289.1 hypothetical protein Poli38472_011877 [Pythium oligandrum]